MSVPRYWREMPAHFRLLGSECKECGKKFIPVRKVCPFCGSRNIKEVEMPKTGKVITFSVVRTAPKEFKRYLPYAIALVELDNGARVLSQITDCSVDEVRIGMRVEAVFRKVSEDGDEGIVRYGYKFRPIFKEVTSSP